MPTIAHHRRLLVPALALAILSPLLLAPGCNPPIIVMNGESIQDAVDQAQPGDTILVLPGTYTGTPGDDSVVDVQTSNIAIRGTWNAVIDATGFEYGIMVGQPAHHGDRVHAQRPHDPELFRYGRAARGRR